MKTIWTIIAVVAVLNLLAIGGLVGWLQSSGRLSRERVTALRSAFAQPVAMEVAAKEQAAAEAKKAEDDKAAAEKAAIPPKPASDVIAEQRFRDEQQAQVLLRQQQDLENLRASLMTKLSELESREKKLEAEKKAFAADRARIAEIEGTKQFRDALTTLESQKAKDAKAVLNALLEGKQEDQAVAYLAKMDEGKRAKVIAEFVKDNPPLAAELLERLRTRGVTMPSPTPGADGVQQARANEPSAK
jgi:hypothetical protein